MTRLLFIAPLPPPVTGQSLASETLYQGLKDRFQITLINYSRPDALSPKQGFADALGRIFRLIRELSAIRENPDHVYFTITQSRMGNIRDLLVLFLLGRNIRQRTVIHLHGGYFHELFQKLPAWQKALNRWLYGGVQAGIVLGESLVPCLLPVISPERIRVIPNFFSPELLIPMMELRDKWKNTDKLKILFLSNFLPEKGYRELLDAFLSLEPMFRGRLELHFAGSFPDEESEMRFLQKIDGQGDIHYHGQVLGFQKKELLWSSHLFFLPTYYPVEGQPISILEAYASGLSVFTTRQGGIPDVFQEPANGRFLEKKSVQSIVETLVDIYKNPETARRTGFYNRETGVQFGQDRYIKAVQSVLE